MNPETSIRYQLLAQYRNNTILVEDTQEKRDFVTTPQKIVCNREVIGRFTSQDASLIGYIAGFVAATVK